MRSIRTVLIWLLMLAVPAQAVTAATMAFCGPGHHGSSHGRAQVGAPAQPQGGAEHGHGHARHKHTTGEPAADHVASADPAPAPADHGDEKKCSACASCCSVAVIPNIAQAVPAPEFGAAVFAAPDPGVDAYAADGPERPPRPRLG